MLQNILLSITQAITELFPISSSGHLIIVEKILNLDLANFQLLMTFLHFWTALAIIIYYFNTLLELIKTKAGWIKLGVIGLATIPAALFGMLFDNTIERIFYSLIIVAINSIFWGAIMIKVENLYNQNKLKPLITSEFWQIITVGFAQILALIPGTSRSGVTTVTGMIIGKSKAESLDVAFLLGIPITLGPFFIEAIKAKEELGHFLNFEMLISGIITFVFGYLAIKLLHIIKNYNFMTYFGIYRIALGLGIILVLIIL